MIDGHNEDDETGHYQHHEEVATRAHSSSLRRGKAALGVSECSDANRRPGVEFS